MSNVGRKVSLKTNEDFVIGKIVEIVSNKNGSNDNKFLYTIEFLNGKPGIYDSNDFLSFFVLN
jgi:hypothetical protein